MSSAPRSSSESLATQVAFGVTGMTCGACVARVENAIRTVAGVAHAEVNLVTRRARVEGAETLDVSRVARAVEEAGYGVVLDSGSADGDATEHAKAELATERRQVRDAWIAAILTVPLMVIAMTHGAWHFAHTPAGQWTQFALATLVLFWPGSSILGLALRAAKHGAADMNTLIGLGALAAWLASVADLLRAAFTSNSTEPPALYFEATATILTFVLLGRMLEHRARRRLGDAVAGMRALVPERALRMDPDGTDHTVAVASLQVGDVVRVRPGDRLPADGIVVEGTSVLDESLLTGESVPVRKTVGMTVTAGTLNQDGALRVRITQSGERTTLARIAHAVSEAQGSRAPIARLADRVAARFVPVVLALAVITLIAWWTFDPTHSFAHALERAIAVLVIACPCALGLATPAAVAVGAGRAAELGILFRNGEALEATARLDWMFLDKTGTLTEGRPRVLAIHALAPHDETRVLALVAAVERSSEHPLARAIVAAATERGIEIPASSEFENTPGAGASAVVEGRRIRVGTEEWFARSHLGIGALAGFAAQEDALGRSLSFVAIDDRCVAALSFADQPAEGARAAVSGLIARKVRPVMLTGDRLGAAKAIANELGIAAWIAEALPTQKVEQVVAARQRGSVVGMVGDGVNDAPALARADVGFAMGHGTDIAANASDVTLLRGGARSIVVALDLARGTLATIRRNLALAFLYNVLAIPIAAGVLEPASGFSLSPMIASATMALSSLSVVTSSLLLRKFSPRSWDEGRSSTREKQF